MHAPMHYEYSTELASALQHAGDADSVRLVVCADFPYAAQCDARVDRLYADYKRKSNKLTRLLSHLAALGRIAWMLLRWRPGVFHVQALRHAELDWPLLAFARLLRIPVVWTAHNSLPHERRAHHRRLYGLIYALANAIIVHTRHTADALVEQNNVPRNKMNIIAHGNLLRMTVPAPPRARARAELGLSPSAFVLFFFGRIRPYKGLDLLLDAFAQLDDPNVALIVAGEDLFGSCDGLSAADNVILDLRRIDDASTARYFSACDLVVLPYRRIDQSGVLMLAMSYDRPVMATQVGGLAEVIDHDVTGFLLPPDDSHRLAREIASVRAHPERLESVRKSAHDAVRTTYGWDQLAARTMAMYRALRAC
ncbi:hypothetical protein GCM10028792_22290 [Salinisphaera aquimarina]